MCNLDNQRLHCLCVALDMGAPGSSHHNGITVGEKHHIFQPAHALLQYGSMQSGLAFVCKWIWTWTVLCWSLTCPQRDSNVALEALRRYRRSPCTLQSAETCHRLGTQMMDRVL